MFQALCGVAVACAVAGQPAEPVQPPAVQRPPAYLDQDNGCEAYNCIGPRTAFRLPDEVPYADYERQYFRPPPGR